MDPINLFSKYQNSVNANVLIDSKSASSVAHDLRSAEHMSAGKKLFLNIITLGIAGHFIDKRERAADERALKQFAQDVVVLKNKLEGLEEGQHQGFVMRMGDVDAEIAQSSTNVITGTIEGREIASPFTAKELVVHLEHDMVDNIDFYGKRAVCDLLESKRNPQADIGTNPSRDRELCLKVLHKLVNMDEQDFANTPTSLLHSFAINALNTKDSTPETLRTFQADMANARHIASEDAQGLLEKLSAAMKNDSAAVRSKVTLEGLRAPVSVAVGAQGGLAESHMTTWKDVHNLAADLICNEDSQVYDANLGAPGKRIKETFAEHATTLTDIMQHRELLNTLPAAIRAPISDAIGEVEAKMRETTGVGFGALNTTLVRMALALAPESVFAECENDIDVFVQTASSQIQGTVTEQFSRLFEGGESPANAPSQPVEDLNNRAAQAEQGAEETVAVDQGPYVPPAHKDKTAENIERETTMLDEMLQASSGAKSGQGQFMSAVFSKYFDHMSSIDQRNMIAASIRYATDQESQGVQLGALLKGAGPIMQKMLQGLNINNMDPEMQKALGDMKDSLASIHPKVITAHLLDMVEKSNGEITNITVNRSLGAASVGQAFLCTMTKKDGTTEECVVKILRPDVQNRAFREKALFVEASKQVPGMEVTFAGQLKRIMEELDLRLEAQNVGDGAVYDGALGCKELASMKLSALVEPTANTMVIEKAPGSTLAGYLRDTREQLDSLLASVGERDTFESILEKKQKLEDMFDDTARRQQHLSSLSSAWVEEGIFGKGFYHGDLHAGNIMTDTDKMTVIDFGNATSLDKDQQGSVTRMMCGASIGDSKMFLKSYRELLSSDGEKIFKTHEAEIRDAVDEVMMLGGAGQTGQRIGVILTRLQNLGLELPAPIYNFSQCQLRLQAALDGMNTLMIDIARAMTQTGTSRTHGNPLPMLSVNANVLQYMDTVSTKQKDVLDNIAREKRDLHGDCSSLAIYFEAMLPDAAEETKGHIPPEHTVLHTLFDECVRTHGTPEFNDAVQKFITEAETINRAQLDKLEAFVNQRSEKKAPGDFSSCMSSVISNHLHTVISQLGFIDSVRMHWLRV